MAYRYANSNNFLRLEMTNPTSQLDRDLVAGVDTFPLVLTITGGTAAKLVVGAA